MSDVPKKGKTWADKMEEDEIAKSHKILPSEVGSEDYTKVDHKEKEDKYQKFDMGLNLNTLIYVNFSQIQRFWHLHEKNSIPINYTEYKMEFRGKIINNEPWFGVIQGKYIEWHKLVSHDIMIEFEDHLEKKRFMLVRWLKSNKPFIEKL